MKKVLQYATFEKYTTYIQEIINFNTKFEIKKNRNLRHVKP